MSELIVTIHRAEKDWPGYTKRTRITGYGVGVHSMTSDHWESRVEFVGRPRITAALHRRDIEVREIDLGAEPPDLGGEA